WGYCDFPLVDGDKLICTPGGPANTIVALNNKTGRLLWKCAVPESKKCTYSAVIIAELGGVRQYVSQLGEGVVGVAADNGRLLWHYPKMTHKYGNVHTPMIWDDAVFTLCGWNLGCALLKPVPAEEGFDIEERYKAEGNFDSWIGSSIRIGNDVYSFSKNVCCVDLSTGKPRWSGGKGYARSPVIFADGRFYVRRGDGNVRLAEATPDGITLHGEFDIPPSSKARTWTFPVVAGGRLYLRDQDLLYCYDVRGPDYRPPKAVWKPPKPIAAPSKNTSSKQDVAESEATRDRGAAVDAIFVPTPQDIVEKMLEAAKVTRDDVLYDLGSGEGRIVITAAKVYGCKSIGCEIDKNLVRLSRENARKANVEDLVTIKEMDLLKADLSEASVVTLYLGPAMNRKLIRQLDKLRPGSRIVSHEFDMPGIRPDKVVKAISEEDDIEHTIYLWTTPLKRE
ncbi:MAG: outer membrane protein assembly factor BamB family protein, partial [Planctomycetota bacterium]